MDKMAATLEIFVNILLTENTGVILVNSLDTYSGMNCFIRNNGTFEPIFTMES